MATEPGNISRRRFVGATGTGALASLASGWVPANAAVEEPFRARSTPVVTMDWTATFLDVAGARPAAAHPLDGKSLAPHLFDGAPAPAHDLFWRMKGQRALRRGDLKYLRLTDGTDRLHDLSTDIHEQANLATRRPGDLAALRTAWETVDATLVPY